jgi:DNA-binding NarL/FixJ family response regulator
MKKFSCILIDDDPLAIDRLESLLLLTKTTSSILKICDASKAVSLIHDQRPDVVFIDVEMPHKSGFAIVDEVRSKLFFPTFIFSTAYNQYAIKAIKTEAFDYLLKPIDLDELNETITRYLNHHKKLHLPESCCLTSREREVMELVAEGKTSCEIAETLHLSKHTVDTHRRKVSGKMK